MRSEYYNKNWQKVDEVIDLMSKGTPRKDACYMVGLHPSSFTKEMNKNPEFGALVEKATATFKSSLISDVVDHQSWQSSAWLLERLHKEEFGKIDLKVIRVEELPKITDTIVNILVEELGQTHPEIVQRIAERISGTTNGIEAEYEVLDLGKEMQKVDKHDVKRAEIELREQALKTETDPDARLKITNEIINLKRKRK